MPRPKLLANRTCFLALPGGHREYGEDVRGATTHQVHAFSGQITYRPLLRCQDGADCQYWARLFRQHGRTVSALKQTVQIGITAQRRGQREARRELSRQEGKQTRGPADYREVGCGCVSHYGEKGDRLHTVRHARMPETKKLSLKRQLVAEVENAFRQQPNI